MILRVTIEGFESHADAVFEFGPGLNLLCGESDSGKSSVLRAICLAAYNRWSDKMLRIGEKTARVKIETERGYVDVTRGNKHLWEVCLKKGGQEQIEKFTNIGRGGVPDIACEVLGMPKVELAGRDNTPNAMFQSDKHFLLAELDGKSCSGNMVAQVFDEVSGLSGLEGLINNISLDGGRARKRLKQAEEEKAVLLSTMHDEDMIKSRQEVVVKTKVMLEELEKQCNRLEGLRSIRSAREAAKAQLASVEVQLSNYSRLDDADALMGEMRAKQDKLTHLHRLRQEVAQARSRELQAEDALSKMPDYDSVAQKLSGMEKDSKALGSLTSIAKERRSLVRHCKEATEQLAIEEESMKEYAEMIGELVRENPNCPTCGQLLTESAELRSMM